MSKHFIMQMNKNYDPLKFLLLRSSLLETLEEYLEKKRNGI